MKVKELRIINFKNHGERHFRLTEGVNCFTGDNGTGKTNILHALYYFAFGKSFLGGAEQQGIKDGEDFFRLQIFTENDENIHEYAIILPKEGKKQIKKNDKALERLSELIGEIPAVMISPYDSNLINDSGELRRKFLDASISQTSAEYLDALQRYHQSLKQRNSLLKNFAKNRYYDEESLSLYTPMLEKYGDFIYLKRKEFLTQMLPHLQEFYQTLSGGKEYIGLEYDSSVTPSAWETLFQEHLQKDLALGYTSHGIHRDDVVFLMNGEPMRKRASQGQQKSFLIALKLAQAKIIRRTLKTPPLLLLDDIFDKLDDHRVTNLISMVNTNDFGQIFITDSHPERIHQIVRNITDQVSIFNLNEEAL